MTEIPKVIHYCWFGRNPLPKLALKCIASWRKFLPDYEIKEWNEDNFDVNIIPYTAEAYKAKKYAFVSDYARIWVLYHYGGIYFDTDVEVIKPMDDILSAGGHMGIELCQQGKIYVNPGLGFSCEKGNVIGEKILSVYAQKHFVNIDGSYNYIGIVPITTEILKQLGLKAVNKKQKVENINIYPIDFFNPYDYTKDRLRVTSDSYSIHWFDSSWVSTREKIRLKVSACLRKLLS